MTRKQIKKLKLQILALNWDANRKRAKAVNLSKKLFDEAQKHAQFTPSDYRRFFRSRGIKQSWV
jgi:hypothetical protein